MAEHMSDPTESSFAPATPAAASRPPHDRELPVTPIEDGRADHAPEPAPADDSAASVAPESTNAAESSATSEAALTEDQVKLALRRVKDPDLNLNILDLGLVYAIRVEGSAVAIDMTLTSPGCPSGPEIMGDAERHLKALPGVGDVAVNLVWSPFWSPDRIEPRVRAYLGF
jgi:metal-sulfur cluster biosynthetic enzyme